MKDGLSLFLQGLRSRPEPAGVRVIAIKPGPVETLMTEGCRTPHISPIRKVARDIFGSLERGSPDVLYTPGIWRYIMTAVKLVPEAMFKRLPLSSILCH